MDRGDAHQPLLKLAWGPFDDAAAAHFARIASGPPAGYYRQLAGADPLLRVFRDDGGVVERCASVLLRQDDDWQGPELTLVAAGGRAPGADLMGAVLPVIEDHAVSAGFVAVRFHTRRPGLVRRAARAGYDTGETVCRKELVA
jgi:hypothetical protein